MSKDQRPSLSSRLLRYSAVASVATGAMLSAAPAAPVLADPIVIDVEPDVTLTTGSYQINLDSYGPPEVGVTVIPGAGFALLTGSNAQFARPTSNYYPAALSRGESIGPTFTNPTLTWGSAIAAPPLLSFFGALGNWTSAKVPPDEIHYLGIQFAGTGGMHYGWIELSITRLPTPSITIHRYGYDDTASAPIPASVDIASASASSGLQAIAAGAFAALGGALTWIRRKLQR